ncbi:MAG: ABC transporter permease, partial [Wujia sp.]
MYYNILKRDLKRRKTLNVILLLFTILATIFVSSGLSNVINVMNGTDYFLDKAGIGDYVVITQNGDGDVPEVLDSSDNVSGYRFENCFWASKDKFLINGKEPEMKNNVSVINAISDVGIKLFLSDNTELTSVNHGEIYVTAGFLDKNNAKAGDTMQITFGDTCQSFLIAGEFKDALLGSDMMGNIRFVISEEDYEVFAKGEGTEPYKGYIFYIDSENESDLSSELSMAKNIIFDGSRSIIKMCYVMEMIVAMIVLVLSICLIIVSFVILKFVITFSINEEFREIGVMKAIGITNLKIRSLYIVKYLFMAVLGGIIGFVISIPFGNMLLSSVSKKMLLGNDSGIILNIVGAIIVMLLMVGFTYICTGKVKKSTPVDAIRNGQTGERYKKKSAYSLCKSRTGGALYMAINDVLSAPKRFLTIVLSFFLCSVFVLGVVLVADTMNSKNLITTFGKEADVYITDSKLVNMEVMSENGGDRLKDIYLEMENTLAENGIPGNVSMEIWYKYNCEVDGKACSITFQQNTETKTTDYEYTEGSAPQSANEIAITPTISKKLGVKIGDTVTVDFGVEKLDCIVVGYFQTMNLLGEVIKLHETAPTSME